MLHNFLVVCGLWTLAAVASLHPCLAGRGLGVVSGLAAVYRVVQTWRRHHPGTRGARQGAPPAAGTVRKEDPWT